MSRLRRFIGVPATIIVVSGLAGAAAGCSGSGSASSAGGASGGGNAAVHASSTGGRGVGLKALAPGTAEPFSATQDVGRTAADGGKLVSNQLKSLPALQSAVIKTADVGLRVDHGHFGQTRAAIRKVAGDLGGYETRSSTSGSRIHNGQITIRVPVRSFGQAMDAIEAVAHVHVTAESVTGQDVTQQFVDLHARLVNLGAQERVLLRLMDRAQTISESIRVENYLQQVEFQIEDVQGRILYLQNRTSMSTITVALQEAGKKPAPPQHANAFWKAGARSLGAAEAVVTSVIVGAGLVLPISILLLIAVLVGRRLAPLAPRLRPRHATGATPSNEG
jgi:Domain of unknown function (DUF4349)